MPSQVITSVENSFTKGLVTEFTGLNFPENAATDTENCEYTIVGDVIRREGINNEVNGTSYGISRAGNSINSYKWNNVGGDGSTQVVVEQIGGAIYFFRSSSATVAAPLSTTQLPSIINIASFVASGGSLDITQECQFSDGNGYLFVYHPSCDPFYCTYSAGTVTANVIDVQIRDFIGIVEAGVPDNFRPGNLTISHEYNLLNQGWRNDGTWLATSTTVVPFSTLSAPMNVNSTFTVTAGIPGITPSTPVLLQATIFDNVGGSVFLSRVTGVIISYTGTNLTINTNPIGYTGNANITSEQWAITPLNPGGQIGTWTADVGGYPSNADVWWQFKDTTDTFNPTATIGSVTLSSPAPKGSFVLDAFNQDRSTVSSIGSLTTVSTTVRPRTGTWFQGRVWYAGADSSFTTGPVYTWTENIYFSQIITDPSQFGECYQVNDPSSSTLFDLLPTDGGVIQIQGCGSVYRLFPIQNGMLVFAANGVWFITGSQGIGFAANDYTITKISSVQSISGTSFVNVLGLPYFWNEEGIYAVTPSQQGSLTVEPLTVGTILSFYNEIPISSKKYARGDYHPIDYVIQWVYRDTEAPDVTGRYTYNKILNFNTYNKAFFPYTIDTSLNSINGIIYVSSPGGSNAPDPTFKYLSSNNSFITFSEEYDTDYVDWGSINYVSFFTTGYKLHGQGQRRFQIPYIYFYSRADVPTSYKVQGLWDYATTGNSGRWSTAQLINNWSPNFGVIFRRHKIRGRGLVLQLKVSSSDGQPFDIIGWSTFESQNTGV